MLVDLSILVERWFGKGGACPYELVPPPWNFLIADIIEIVGSFEWLHHSLFGLRVLSLDHFVDLPKLIIDLLENQSVLLIEHLLILFYFDIHVLDLIKLLLQGLDVLFIILRDTWNWIFTGDHTMVFVDRAPVYAVNTQQLELVFAVKSNEVIVKQTFLRHLIFKWDLI